MTVNLRTASRILIVALSLAGAIPATVRAEKPLHERVTHAYTDNDGVKIHHVSLGTGPLIVMLHGFPDYWYTWRHQMEALAEDHKVVALDLRGYNRSDKPQGVEAYDMRLLIGDVAAEAFVLGLLGTSIGAALGFAGGRILENRGIDTSALAGADVTIGGVAWDPIWRATLTPESVFLPVVVMWGVCLVASLFPAILAARLDPVEAMRRS